MGGVIALRRKSSSHHTLAFISFCSLKGAVIQKRFIIFSNYDTL